MKKGSDGQPVPKEEIGELSSNRRQKKLMNHLENSIKKMKLYLGRVEDARRPTNFVMVLHLPPAENIKSGWRTVEVASSFNTKGKPAGGGFLLRESNAAKTPLLAEAFPLQGESELFAEVCALQVAMEMSTDLARLKNKKGGIVFLFESAECFKETISPTDYAGPIIDEFRNDLLWTEFEFMQVPGEKLAAAKWLAEHGKTSQQHSVFDSEEGPWPPGLAELLARPPL